MLWDRDNLANEKDGHIRQCRRDLSQTGVEITDIDRTCVYDWRHQLKSLGKQIFLDYKPSYQGRGVEQIFIKQK